MKTTTPTADRQIMRLSKEIAESEERLILRADFGDPDDPRNAAYMRRIEKTIRTKNARIDEIAIRAITRKSMREYRATIHGNYTPTVHAEGLAANVFSRWFAEQFGRGIYRPA